MTLLSLRSWTDTYPVRSRSRGVVHMWTSGNRGREPETTHSAAVRALSLGGSHMGGTRWPDLLVWMFRKSSRRSVSLTMLGAGSGVASVTQSRNQLSGLCDGMRGMMRASGPMTPWLVHELRERGLNVVCLDARHASAALKMQMNKTDRNDAEGLAQIMRTGWYRSVHVKSLDAHRTRALLGARAQLVSMTTRLSNHIRGVLKTFGMLPGAMRGLPFDRRVEALLAERDDLAAIVRPMLTAWRQLREQIAVFDKAVRALAKKDPTCRLLMSVPGIPPCQQ